jgi:hypothetical protein
LSGTTVEDDDLLHLCNLQNLELLVIHSTAVGDAGLAQLTSMQSLAYVYASYTKVTAGGIPGARFKVYGP